MCEAMCEVLAAPVLTGREFDLIWAALVILVGFLTAVVLIGLLVVSYWYDEAVGQAADDLMAVADAVRGPDAERLP